MWSTDITYIRLSRGFVYLAAILDWYSRKVLAWRLSNTLETRFCLDCLDEALRRGQPLIFNSDQGAQFTSTVFTGRLVQAGIRISMDGRGRAHDNIFVERLWRSVKYEEVYPNGYDTLDDAYHGLHRYFEFYNHQRPHQALDYRTPAEVYADRAIILSPRNAEVYLKFDQKLSGQWGPPQNTNTRSTRKSANIAGHHPMEVVGRIVLQKSIVMAWVETNAVGVVRHQPAAVAPIAQQSITRNNRA